MRRGPLLERYGPEDLHALTPAERERFLPLGPERVAWELLYRVEPELYARLVEGERLHPGILDWLPARVPRACEVGAGAGRLTRHLLDRCEELVAVEPAAPLRRLLGERTGVRALDGFFDALPLPDGWADLTISCSAFTLDEGDAGLRELERVTVPGGLVVLVWPPTDHGWLERRGFACVSFPGEMAVEFGSVEEAKAMAEIFYPDAACRVSTRRVPYSVLGTNPPRDLAWKRR